MVLTRAHAAVEGDHRRVAWRMVSEHTSESSAESAAVVDTCEQALALWLAYRDGVARGMGL
jgi:pyrroloquinoline-quinone synthase